MNIKLMQDRVLVKVAAAQEQTDSGIYIPDPAKDAPTEGEVVAVGEGKKLDDGTVQPMDVAIGDKVMFPLYSGTKLKLDGEEYLLFREEDLLGVILPE
jgi:chaperonin GroES